MTKTLNPHLVGRSRFLFRQAREEAEASKLSTRKKFNQMKVIFPESFVKSVNEMPEEKIYDYCFIGAFAFWVGLKKFNSKVQNTGFRNRKWVIDYAKKNFTEKSIFINTSKGVNLKKNWQTLGVFDKTFKKKSCLPKSLENKGIFDEDYYRVMKGSNFSLCPAGDAPWSIRFFEALMCKSIPVVNKHSESWRLQEEKKAGYFYYLTSDKKVYSKEIVDHNYKLFIKNHTYL